MIMKRLNLVILLIFFFGSLFSQIPQYINYQAIYKDEALGIYKKSSIAVVISILQGSPSASEVFTETHSITTNEDGLFTLMIGSVNQDDFTDIDWYNGPYFLGVNVNGTDFGTSQILSVPYAFYSENSGDSFSREFTDLKNIPEDFNPSIHVHAASEINDLSTVSITADYNDLVNNPTELSEFNNDVGYLTSINEQDLAALNSIVIGDTTIDSSAILEIDSNSKGFLPPRLNSQEIFSIINPAEGLIVYNTDLHSPVYFNRTEWVQFDGNPGLPFEVGNKYQGGTIVSIDESGHHGIIATQDNISGGNNVDWYTAVENCNDYSVVFDEEVYDDWRMPTIEEALDTKKSIFNSSYIWSSTEIDQDNAYQAITTWETRGQPKYILSGVAHPVRDF